MAVNQIELDFLASTFGTNHHMPDEMLLNSKERTLHLIKALSEGSYLSELSSKSPILRIALENGTNNDSEQAVMIIGQQLNHTLVPPFTFDTDFIEMVEDLLEMPLLINQIFFNSL